jgi:hypothetical protein
MSELAAVERENRQHVRNHRVAMDDRSPMHAQLDEETATRRIESVLSRLEQIEHGIMQTPAHTIAGLGVKVASRCVCHVRALGRANPQN